MLKASCVTPLLLVALTFAQAHAAPLLIGLSPNLTQGRYSGSIERSTYSDHGLRLSLSEGDVGGVGIRYSRMRIGRNQAPAILQDNYAVSAYLNQQLDGDGTLSYRVDGYRENNNDSSGLSGGATTYASRLSWLSAARTLRLSMAYARSSYPDALTVRQYTPALGIGLDHDDDWQALRLVLVRGLDPARAEGRSGTTGGELSWTHAFRAGLPLLPAYATLGLTLGEQVYAVNMDAMSVANLADIQRGGLSLGVDWKLSRHADLYALAAQTRYSNLTLANNYRLDVAYLDFLYNW